VTELEYTVDSVLAKFDCDKWLDRYWAFLFQENQKVNLVSRETDLPQFRRLVAEALLPFSQISRCFDSYLDIGSGGGIPAIPLLLSGIAKGEAMLYERTKKKAVALARLLGNLEVSRAKVVPSYVSLTPTLCESIRSHLSPGGILVYYSRPEFEPKNILAQYFSYSHSGSDTRKHFSILTK
jgi:hypothetical protein